MADSVRHQIMDAVIAALNGITTASGYQTDVALVSEQVMSYDQIPPKHLPALFPIDTNEDRQWFALAEQSENDIQAELDILITAVVYDKQNVTRLKRTNLLRDVEKALLNDADLKALILYAEPQRVETDEGNIPDFSIFDYTIRITYTYDSANGG